MDVPASIMPGYTVSPLASIVRAPLGTATLAPTAVILPSAITTVPRAISGPVTVTIFALVMAYVPRGPGIGLCEPSCACAGENAPASITPASSAAPVFILQSPVCFMAGLLVADPGPLARHD